MDFNLLDSNLLNYLTENVILITDNRNNGIVSMVAAVRAVLYLCSIVAGEVLCDDGGQEHEENEEGVGHIEGQTQFIPGQVQGCLSQPTPTNLKKHKVIMSKQKTTTTKYMNST